jgi:hypothetical protein
MQQLCVLHQAYCKLQQGTHEITSQVENGVASEKQQHMGQL